MTSPSVFVDLMAGPARPAPNPISAEVTSHPWAVYDPESGVETFKTQEEAVAWAADTVQEFNNDGWMEEVENVFVAHITHVPVKTVLGVKAEMTEDAWNELTAGQADPAYDDEWWRYDLVSADLPFSDQPDATPENPYPHWGTEGPVGRIEKLTSYLALANASTKRRGEERDALRLQVAELEAMLAAEKSTTMEQAKLTFYSCCDAQYPTKAGDGPWKCVHCREELKVLAVAPKRVPLVQQRERGLICSYPENGGGGHVEYCNGPLPCREHGR